MKLTAQMMDLAKRAASVKEARASGVAAGLVWTSEHLRVDPRAVPPGHHIALDLYVRSLANDVGAPGSYPELRTAGEAPTMGRCVERFTAVEGDEGIVYDSSGVRIGRMLSHRGSLMRWELDVPSATAG